MKDKCITVPHAVSSNSKKKKFSNEFLWVTSGDSDRSNAVVFGELGTSQLSLFS